MMLHTQARELLREGFRAVAGRSPSERELDFAQAIAWGETLYGRGGQFAAMAARGLYNWGALQRPRSADGSCPSGYVEGMDAGNERCFRGFTSEPEAVRSYLFTLLKPRTVAAMASGEALDVAEAMQSYGYFETTAEKYAAMIDNGLGVGRSAGGIDDDGRPFGSIPRGTSSPSSPASGTSWQKVAGVTLGLGAAVALAMGAGLLKKPRRLLSR